jgi:hypothetical protein
MPHVLGPAGGPPPATHNETLLQAEVDRLRGELTAARENERRANSLHAAARAELRAARQVVEATRGWLRDGEAAGSTDVIHAVTTAIMAYDKVTGGK